MSRTEHSPNQKAKAPERGSSAPTGYPEGWITLEDQCKPDRKSRVRWRKWRGDRAFPYPPEQLVRVRLRCGGVGKLWLPASSYQWRHRNIVQGRHGVIAVAARSGEGDHPGDITGFVLPEDFQQDVNPEKLKGSEG